MICTRCEGTGFLNLHQMPKDLVATYLDGFDSGVIFEWMDDNVSDVQVCDCCGDGVAWTYIPGLHHPTEVPDCI